MLREKITKEFVLSDDDKQIIKNNAQKIKNYLARMGYDNCAEFFNTYCDRLMHTFLSIFEGLPFTENEYEYLTVDDTEDIIKFIDSVIENVKSCITKDDFEDEADLIDFITDRYDNNIKLARKIVEVCDEKSLNKLLND